MPVFAHKFARPATEELEGPPPVQIRYFYASPLPIDDPLSPVPPPSTAPTNLSPRPFSAYDNTILDRAWNDLRGKILKYREERESEKAAYQKERRESGASLLSVRGSPVDDPSTPHSRSRKGSVSKAPQGISRVQELSQWAYWDQSDASTPINRRRSGTLRASFGVPESMESSPEGITGLPFARAPVRTKNAGTSSRGTSRVKEINREAESRDGSPVKSNNELVKEPKSAPQEEPSTKIPVGVSRLHQVLMPGLSMEPVYWSPVHDIATVARGTWFYKDSMLPVEVDVANMLEAGYVNLRPWTKTWEDELNSAVEVGAAGEEKIIHHLWPASPPGAKAASRPGSSMGLNSEGPDNDAEKQRDETLRAACDLIDVFTNVDGLDTKAAGTVSFGRDGQKRLYLASSVLYANEREAYILRPNLQPSAYHGRRPLANYIRKGRNIGVCVVRGFDQAIWDKLNPPKTGKTATAAQEGVSTSQAGQPIYRRMQSDPSLSKANSPQVTDLVLVIHGIGQKLSERVESFHFTHAMNAFRREVNVELGTPNVKAHLREDMGGIMVLPVNWRTSLTFEEGGYRDGPEDLSTNSYGLKDITVETLPSVRDMIADVMLDIPYYLSHHQPTMIRAVIAEANRIHRLWCKHNPGFEHYGRVHLLAHSLGSVMALDILSKQPTFVRTQTEERREPEHFRFDTKNLYLCGSPAGFFLLLKKSGLLPRKDRNKPYSEGEDLTPGVAGEVGTYGCIAVDNIYNIVNPYDPVAYRINATVDANYAASLKPAIIPSATGSWFSLGNPFKGSTTAAASMVHVKKPSLTNRMPSSVELETHNFTREEIAEKRFNLLNDNGQIDFFLRYGGGALEIQYLTMLGAHSSYWISKDFIRFITVETGRRFGKAGTLLAMKAVKKKGIAV